MKPKIPVLVLAIAAAIFLIIPLISVFRSAGIRKTGMSAEGIVTATRSNSKGGLTQVKVLFTTHDGSEIEATASKRQYVSTGDKVELWYDPVSPDKIDFGDTTGYNMRGVIIGGLLFILGIFLFVRYSIAENASKKLIRSGRKIVAEFVSVDRNEKYRMGDNNPQVIKCRWTDPANGQEYYFVSNDYTIDPLPYLDGRTAIDVYINVDNPEKYHMDTSFMPKGNITIG